MVKDGQVLQRSGFVSNRTLSAVMQQMMSSGSSYLLATQAKSPYRSNNETWASYLESSGGFEVLYSSCPPGASTIERSYGLVLLKRTGQISVPTRTQPTLMSADTVNSVISYQGTACKKRARSKGAIKKDRLVFLNGTKFIGKQRDVEKARRTWNKIYGPAASEGS